MVANDPSLIVKQSKRAYRKIGPFTLSTKGGPILTQARSAGRAFAFLAGDYLPMLGMFCMASWFYAGEACQAARLLRCLSSVGDRRVIGEG